MTSLLTLCPVKILMKKTNNQYFFHCRDAVVELRNIETSSSCSDSDLEQNHECISNGSGDTEGPETDEAITSEEEATRLAGHTNGGREKSWPYDSLEEPDEKTRTDYDMERHQAQDFAKLLATDLVPRLLRLRSCVECDQALQEFSSTVCKDNLAKNSDSDSSQMTPMNGDGIYLATCSALLFAWQLMRAGHYQDGAAIAITFSEQQFITSVQKSGVLVNVSTFWLCELYQSIIVANPLALLHEFTAADGRCPLVELLRDAGGFGATQMLSDWQHLLEVSAEKPSSDECLHSFRREAAKKLARRLLTCGWDSVVTILSCGLGGDAGGARNTAKDRLVALSHKSLKLKQSRRNVGGSRESLFALSLEGLHAAATLSNSLNLQCLAGKILQLLAGNICRIVGPRITASQALSMDVVLSGGLELGSYSADCWAPVFAVCRHITYLEHALFSMHQPSVANNYSDGMVTANRGANDANANERKTLAAGTGGNDKLNLTASPIEDDETW